MVGFLNARHQITFGRTFDVIFAVYVASVQPNGLPLVRQSPDGIPTQSDQKVHKVFDVDVCEASGWLGFRGRQSRLTQLRHKPRLVFGGGHRFRWGGENQVSSYKHSYLQLRSEIESSHQLLLYFNKFTFTSHLDTAPPEMVFLERTSHNDYANTPVTGKNLLTPTIPFLCSFWCFYVSGPSRPENRFPGSISKCLAPVERDVFYRGIPLLQLFGIEMFQLLLPCTFDGTVEAWNIT